MCRYRILLMEWVYERFTLSARFPRVKAIFTGVLTSFVNYCTFVTCTHFLNQHSPAQL